MKNFSLLIAVAPLALATPVAAQSVSHVLSTAEGAAVAVESAQDNDAATGRTSARSTKPAQQTFSTGVARARDALDSATSTSTLDEATIQKIGARSVSEIFRAIPGMRSESTSGEALASISIRGLPIALGGAKFLQIQENGLPTLEFGDIAGGTADQFLRADLNLAGVQAIRGGSASTFASNSPGGIVNLIDKTGEVEGGSIMLSAGLDYENYRADFDYGAHLSDTLRFHVGGFYRKGEGQRATGLDSYNGGQIKLNVTKDLAGGGYIRFYGKVLDDRTPPADYVPVRVTGTDAKPVFQNVANFDVARDSFYSRYIPTNLTLDKDNRVARHKFSDGAHSKMYSLGVETQFDVADWTITEKFRFSDISGSMIKPSFFNRISVPVPMVDSAATVAAFASRIAGGTGPITLSYASGPRAGQAITDPTSLNGNGLLALVTNQDYTLESLNNVTNDFRASRVFDLGKGKLTVTAGFYKASQDIKTAWTWTTSVTDVVGGGNAALVNVTANGRQLTQNGTLSYSAALIGNRRRNSFDLNYDVNAPYASINYHIGKIAIGASARYDYGSAGGAIYGAELFPGLPMVISYDINGDGTVSSAETRVATLSLASPAPVNYSYRYWSYSTGINYRAADDLSVFARYSRGGRANADRLLFSGAPVFVSTTSGDLLRKDAAYDSVQQAEGGVKYRTQDFSLFATGFWAKTREHNLGLDRSYRAYGVEIEGSYRRGIFAITAGATYTKAKITKDALVAANVGHVPKHQADLIFQVMPQIETEHFSIGGIFEGTTSSYAQDTNQLKMPGWTVFNAFAQYRPTDRVTLMLQANNLFDKTAFVDINESSIPAVGIVTARTLPRRNISASARFSF